MGIDDRPPQSIEELQARNISTECPHCGDTGLTPQLGTFFTQTSRKS